MKTKIWIIMSAVVLLAAWPAQGVLEDKIFTSSGQILPGESWDVVNIYNDDTVVDMLGGSADYISTFDGSTLNVVDGYAEVGAFDYSTINISGGDIHLATALNNTTVNFFTSDYTDALIAEDSGILNMEGGAVERVIARSSGIANLHAGSITDYLSAYDSTEINIYGYDLVMSTSGGSYGDGQVYGYWVNDSPFLISLRGAETHSHINLIPEPGTLALLALGTLLLRRKR
ncbi:MAG TPA: PEP-CTERM sorting domain-containing protein [Sedimentisphaerales bacterium]|nr:PEP-CTERM sorting domain-containing protein [Sedimentisphaerales bacterium]